MYSCWKSFIESDLEELCGNLSLDETLDTPLPLEIQRMTDAELRSELISYGVTVGPIAPGRKQYQKKLFLYRQRGTGNHCSNVKCSMPYSQELHHLFNSKRLPSIRIRNKDDQTLRDEFAHCSVELKGGNTKDCFNYLLLDPRVTKNLSSRINQLSEVDCLMIFCGAIFYVGKGKGTRDFDHLKDAIGARTQNECSDKLQQILDIWKKRKDCGVILLRVFQNVVSEEACTREAAMIAALGVPHLTNCKRGTCYGSASKWTESRLRHYGAFLLISAMRVHLIEGERQIGSKEIPNQRNRRKVKS
uniref:ankyrin repeat and LEM domain-containing protein 1-like n=1 Tax=Ciona intestinalis TaxID=7719 RepID=UPI0002B8EA66|nr:ankyrin repeat and LEM domain-containing protein 1-like [Ciona intestinalis]|eukprot:XP_004226572.1 ankyrin repeat and LEM domain-containing protein 1-like [Ciona intestinalis]